MSRRLLAQERLETKSYINHLSDLSVIPYRFVISINYLHSGQTSLCSKQVPRSGKYGGVKIAVKANPEPTFWVKCGFDNADSTIRISLPVQDNGFTTAEGIQKG